MIKNEIKTLKYYLPLVFLLLMALYLITMPKTVVMEDDGLFIMSAWFNGVSHPPGYPLHSILSHFATLIPIGSIPARVHAVSAFFGAFAAIVLMLIVFHLTENRMIALLSALILGTSRVFWSQSIVAEIYTLNAFIYLLLIYLALHIIKTSDEKYRNQLFYFSAFIFGLGIANHWPLIILGSSLLLVLYAPYWKNIASNFFKLLFFMFLGLMPYVWMVYRSTQDPVFNFSGELTSFQDFWYVFTRKMYSGLDNAASAGLADKLLFIKWFSQYSLQQFFFLFSPLIIIGFISQWYMFSRKVAMALTAGVITSSFLLIILLNFDFEPINQGVYRVYFIPTYALSVIWLALGMMVLLKWLLKKQVNVRVIYSVFFVFISLQVLGFLKENDRHDDFFAKEYADVVFSILPENTILIVDDDVSLGVFGYYHFVEKKRPDILLINSNSIAFNNRLFHPIHTSREMQEKILSAVYFRPDLPVYSLGNTIVNVKKINYGFIHKFEYDAQDRSYKSANENIEQILSQLVELIKYNKRTYYFEKDTMERLMTNSLLWAAYAYDNATDEMKTQLYNFIIYLCQYPRPLLQYLQLKFGTEDFEKDNWFATSMAKVENNIEVLSKSEKIGFYILKSRYQQLKGIDDGIIWLQKADSLSYDKNNEAAKLLNELRMKGIGK